MPLLLKMTKLKENVNRLNALLKEGKIAEAFDNKREGKGSQDKAQNCH